MSRGEVTIVGMSSCDYKTGDVVTVTGRSSKDEQYVITKILDGQPSMTLYMPVIARFEGVDILTREWTHEGDFIRFHRDIWVGAKITVADADLFFVGDAKSEEVTVGEDGRAPIPWMSIEARVVHEHG
jgi:hypothetical protein